MILSLFMTMIKDLNPECLLFYLLTESQYFIANKLFLFHICFNKTSHYKKIKININYEKNSLITGC